MEFVDRANVCTEDLVFGIHFSVSLDHLVVAALSDHNIVDVLVIDWVRLNIVAVVKGNVNALEVFTGLVKLSLRNILYNIATAGCSGDELSEGGVFEVVFILEHFVAFQTVDFVVSCFEGLHELLGHWWVDSDDGFLYTLPVRGGESLLANIFTQTFIGGLNAGKLFEFFVLELIVVEHDVVVVAV